jgi:hypothetical protein
MKRGLFTALSLTLLFTACKKADVAAPVAATNTGDQFIGAGSSTGLQSSIHSSTVRITSWEPTGGWSKTQYTDDQVRMQTTRSFREMTQAQLAQGALLVFSKGYNFADATMDKPLELPFYFFLPYERMNLPVYWEYLGKLNGVDMSLKMGNDAMSSFTNAHDNIKFRYFILSPQELQRLNKTAQEMRAMSYEQLTTLYHIAP